MMQIMVACEYSGIVRDAFIEKGHDAISCDLLPTDRKGPHIQADILDLDLSGFDLLIAHPPCTYLCSSGLHWNKKDLSRQIKTNNAIKFVEFLYYAPVEKIAIENPVGCLSTAIRKPDQYIQPYEYGHDASKKTCLWLKNLPKLNPTEFVNPRIFNGKKRWGNQLDSGQNKLTPSPDRWKLRSTTYTGWAKAMADQWG